jgi:hypothetical protein
MMMLRAAAGAPTDRMRVHFIDRNVWTTKTTLPKPPRRPPGVIGSKMRPGSCSGCRGWCSGCGTGTAAAMGASNARRIAGQLPETSTVTVSVRAGRTLLPAAGVIFRGHVS